MLELAKQGPQPLNILAELATLVYGEPITVTEAEILRAVRIEGEGGDIRRVLGAQLARWDFDDGSSWADGTIRSSPARRTRIYDLMQFDQLARQLLDDRLPFFIVNPPTVIQAQRWDPWYTPARRAAQSFYWDALCGQLRTQLNWPEQSVLSLDESTDAVTERLADPLSEKAYQSKGVVVGYVQSGKTANITGVVAKAADAGYRLVIILAGTLNLLRDQTQRRIDRELVGRELLEDEYVDDADWPRFLTHGQRPSQLGAFDWTRLTGRSREYRTLSGGAIESMRFARSNPSLPFNHPDNLHTAPVKLLVVKKQATVLSKLARDLARINEDGALANVPALIVDDESDQASVNTIRPAISDDGETERTRINSAIVHLLDILPRAQYIGYTATPFANVFVDPADGADLFPRDFIVGLPRPSGYLGASDFHDLDGTPEGIEDNPFLSNEAAFVRPVYGDDADESNLLRAIDSFLLAGAIKLYRERLDRDLNFRHHTLMIHTSPRIAEHQAQLQTTKHLLETSGYRLGTASDRLRNLFDTDFAPVSKTRAPGLPFPKSFDALDEYLGEVLTRLYRGGDAVLLVNSTNEASQLAFDTDAVWKIIVGGAKLSRGFTVEGLTTSYFRRRSPTADTLMQMGRWCGFRRGYADLVRLFIGRREPQGHESVDVYEAFEAVCRDEEAFREELRRYALPSGSDCPITPMDVPPLVASHLEWVRPTSRNKMFNARITYRNFGGQWSEHRRVVQSADDRRQNETVFRQLFEEVGLDEFNLISGARHMSAYGVVASASQVSAVLHEYLWADGLRDLQQELEFLDGKYGDPQIDEWLILLPQLSKVTERTWDVNARSASVHRRSYWNQTAPLVNAYAGPDDRALAEMITGKRKSEELCQDLRDLKAARRAVMLVYPITHEPPLEAGWLPTMGFSLLFPTNDIARQIGFEVVRSSKSGEPVIDAS
jgi:hypothetical protein